MSVLSGNIASSSSRIVRDGLVFYLDAGATSSYPKSGNSWYDLSQSKMTTVLYESPSFNTENGGTLSFNGSSQYGNIPSNASIPSSGAVSVSAWIYNTKTSGNSPWFKKGTTDGYGLYTNNSVIYVITYGVVNWNTGITLSANAWNNVVFTYNPTGTIQKIYVNNSTTAQTTASYLSASGTCNIAVNDTGAESGYFGGRIGHVTVYNKTLSSEEVSQNFQALRYRYGI